MSKVRINAPARSGEGQCPQPWPPGSHFCVNDVRTYWFQIIKSKPVIVSRPPYPVWPKDWTDPGYIDAMRIVTDCMVHVYLYDMPDRQFDTKSGGVVFYGGEPVLGYYHNLGYMYDANGRAHGASFHAKYRGNKASWTMDKFDLKLVPFVPGNDGPHEHSAFPFDPGVCNPGDDPNGQNLDGEGG